MSLTTDEVWAAFSQRLLAVIRSRVADPSDAEDILQEVFLKVHLHLDSLHDESRLAPWLHQIARNAVADYGRRKRISSELLEEMAQEPADADGRASEQQLARGLRGMIAALPAGYRDALMLAEIEGLSQQEVAARLNLSYSGAKSRVQRGRRLLHQALIDCCHIELDRRGGVIDYVPRDRLCQSCCAPQRC